jgi:hypothetical protein
VVWQPAEELLLLLRSVARARRQERRKPSHANALGFGRQAGFYLAVYGRPVTVRSLHDFSDRSMPASLQLLSNSPVGSKYFQNGAGCE